MVQSRAEIAQKRAARERSFKALRGVSTGTYYEMRRKALARGISPKTFDAVVTESSYKDAKAVTQIANNDLERARYTAAIDMGLISKDVAFADFDTALDQAAIPDEYDWWYHG